MTTVFKGSDYVTPETPKHAASPPNKKKIVENLSQPTYTSTPMSQAGKSTALQKLKLVPEGEGWVIQDEAGHKYPVLIDETFRELVKNDVTPKDW